MLPLSPYNQARTHSLAPVAQQISINYTKHCCQPIHGHKSSWERQTLPATVLGLHRLAWACTQIVHSCLHTDTCLGCYTCGHTPATPSCSLCQTSFFTENISLSVTLVFPAVHHNRSLPKMFVCSRTWTADTSQVPPLPEVSKSPRESGHLRGLWEGSIACPYTLAACHSSGPAGYPVTTEKC